MACRIGKDDDEIGIIQLESDRSSAEEEEESQKAQCVQKYNNKMMTECREARRHGDKLMGGKGMERYLPTQVKFKLRLPPCFVCNKGNCGYRVLLLPLTLSERAYYRRGREVEAER